MGAVELVGHRRYVDGGGPDHLPVLWTTDAVLPNAGAVWVELIKSYRSTGLYPIVLQASGTEPDDGRPWLTGEFDLSGRTEPDRAGTPVHLFGRLYAAMVKEFQADDVPSRTLSTLGSTRSAGPDVGAAIDQVSGLPGRIGLVAVPRPADVPYAIGWLGASNYFDSGIVTAVLRSWEDRYGVQLIRMGFDYVQVSVPDPPRTLAAARQVAMEHVAFCPDQVYQEAGGFEDYAKALVGARSWFCSWD